MSNLVDLHNHSLPGVDDGASNITEALENIKYLKSLGFQKIVLTSHYIENTKFNIDLDSREKILDELMEKVKYLDVQLYLGNEVYITDANTIKNLIEKKQIGTLNSSRYLLMELPMSQHLSNVSQVICSLNDAGIIPIIAHPERYSHYWKHYDELKEMLEYKCYFQCNMDSILGKYGKDAQKQLKRLLKDDLVTVLATDFHRISYYYRKNEALVKLEKILGKEKLNQLLEINPNLILNNEEIN